MSCPAPSKHTAISSTGGPAALPTFSRKWPGKYSGTRCVSEAGSVFVGVTELRHSDEPFVVVVGQKVSLWKKMYVIYSFFFVRKVVAHIVTFVFYCLVMPATVLVPEVDVPKWGSVYVPSTITLLNAVGTPRLVRVPS